MGTGPGVTFPPTLLWEGQCSERGQIDQGHVRAAPARGSQWAVPAGACRPPAGRWAWPREQCSYTAPSWGRGGPAQEPRMARGKSCGSPMPRAATQRWARRRAESGQPRPRLLVRVQIVPCGCVRSWARCLSAPSQPGEMPGRSRTMRPPPSSSAPPASGLWAG